MRTSLGWLALSPNHCAPCGCHNTRYATSHTRVCSQLTITRQGYAWEPSSGAQPSEVRDHEEGRTRLEAKQEYYPQRECERSTFDSPTEIANNRNVAALTSEDVAVWWAAVDVHQSCQGAARVALLSHRARVCVRTAAEPRPAAWPVT